LDAIVEPSGSGGGACACTKEWRAPAAFDSLQQDFPSPVVNHQRRFCIPSRSSFCGRRPVLTRTMPQSLVVSQYFTDRILPLLLSTWQWQSDMNGRLLRSKRFRFLNAEWFGTILAVRAFNRFPLGAARNRSQNAV
jgi:hypothetical protein